MDAVQPIIPIQQNSWAIRMVDSILKTYPLEQAQWHYEHGLVVKAILQAGQVYRNPVFLTFARDWVDTFVLADGTIRTYRKDEFNLDQINPGKLLFQFYRETQDKRFKTALDGLYAQLQGQPRTKSNGFWHKKIYPYQMWLDGIYMASPFLAEYGLVFSQPQLLDEVFHQVSLIYQHTRDEKSGLLYHAWDESRRMPWADLVSGCSPHFWGRALGWFEMALVDILAIFPTDHPGYGEMLRIFAEVSEALLNFQDRQSGMWYQVVDLGEKEGNYLESSVTTMLIYAFAKGVRLGYLSPDFKTAAKRAYRGILEKHITVDVNGFLTLERTCGAAGLGGDPYRDGSYQYYVNEKIIANDFKGVGPFILAALEMESEPLLEQHT